MPLIDTSPAISVLLLHDSHLFGGMEIAMLRSIKGLQVGFRFMLLVRPGGSAAHGSPDRLIEEANFLDVPVLIPASPRHIPGPLRRVFTLLDTYRFIRRVRPDVVHIHTASVEGGRLQTLLARAAGVRSVIRTEHSPPGAFSRPPFGGRIQRYFDGLTSLTVAVSEADRQEQIEVVGRAEEKVRCIRNGVDIERFAPRPTPPDERSVVTVGTIGRLVEVKRHKDLIEAMAILLARRSDVRCVIHGDGDLEAELRAQISRLGLSGVVEIRPPVDDVVPVLASFDIGVMTSRCEGLSLALLEMMAMALPTVVTDVPGLVEVAIDGQTSIVAPVGAPQALAAAIERLADEQALRDRYGRAARERIESQFRYTGHIKDLGEMYQSCVGPGDGIAGPRSRE